jgi:hypothetical protein
MRLKAVERGERLADRILFRIIRIVSGYRAPDVVRTMRYRKTFFGEPHGIHTQAVMRGPSRWTVGERELFAAFVSRLNECQF